MGVMSLGTAPIGLRWLTARPGRRQRPGGFSSDGFPRLEFPRLR
jgi:hypothetical protein